MGARRQPKYREARWVQICGETSKRPLVNLWESRRAGPKSLIGPDVLLRAHSDTLRDAEVEGRGCVHIVARGNRCGRLNTMDVIAAPT